MVCAPCTARSPNPPGRGPWLEAACSISTMRVWPLRVASSRGVARWPSLCCRTVGPAIEVEGLGTTYIIH